MANMQQFPPTQEAEHQSSIPPERSPMRSALPQPTLVHFRKPLSCARLRMTSTDLWIRDKRQT